MNGVRWIVSLPAPALALFAAAATLWVPEDGAGRPASSAVRSE